MESGRAFLIAHARSRRPVPDRGGCPTTWSPAFARHLQQKASTAAAAKLLSLKSGQEATMISLLAGMFAFAGTGLGFWYCLPQNGHVRGFVNTVAEPYFSIALAAGLVLSLGMIAKGFAELIL
jgi:hypothetical protein